MLLAMYMSKLEIEKGFNLKYDTFIQSRSSADGENYRIISGAYEKINHFIIQKFNLMFKNDRNYFEKYISTESKETEYRIKIAYLIEALKLGNYEMSGGQLPQIFIRINDPFKLKTLIQSENYSNEILQDVESRYKRGVKIMDKFFSTPFLNNERWDFIENYFLGQDVI